MLAPRWRTRERDSQARGLGSGGGPRPGELLRAARGLHRSFLAERGTSDAHERPTPRCRSELMPFRTGWLESECQVQQP
jgi:hypothetical protein